METRRQTLLDAAPLAPSSGWNPTGIARVILIAHLLLSPLVFSRDTVEAFEFPKAALLTLTILALGTLVLWDSLKPRANASFGERLRLLMPTWRDPLALGFLLFLASASISTVGSVAPRLSFWGAPESHAGLITILGYAALFFLTRHLCRGTEDAWQLLAAAVVGAITASAYAMVQVAHADPIPWASVSRLFFFVRPFGTLAHPNFLAAYLAMTLPLLLLFADRAIQTRRWAVLAAVLVGTVGAAAAIATACSRGAWLASACALAVCVIGWLALGRGRRIVWGGLAIVPISLAALWLAARFVPAHLDPFPFLIGRLQRFAFAGARKEIWSIALALFGDHPIFGTGLDTFHLMFAQKRTVASWTAEGNMTPLRAHNAALQVLATQGVVGLAALFGMFGGLVAAASEPGGKRRATIGCSFWRWSPA